MMTTYKYQVPAEYFDIDELNSQPEIIETFTEMILCGDGKEKEFINVVANKCIDDFFT